MNRTFAAEADWDALADSEPELYVGRRAGKLLNLQHVPVEAAATLALHEVVMHFLEERGGDAGRQYESTAELERNEEYFFLDRTDLIAAAQSRDVIYGAANSFEDQPMPGESHVALLDALDDLDRIDDDSVTEQSLRAALFYVLKYESASGQRFYFVRKQDPGISLRRARVAFSFGRTLTVTPVPGFAIAEDFDFLLTADSVYVWRKAGFEQLLADVRVDLMEVGHYASDVAMLLSSVMPLQTSALRAVEMVCSTRLSLARRLSQLPGRLVNASLTPERVREALVRHGEDPAMLVSTNGEFSFDESGVSAFLDVVEGRWFEDDFTGEKRRADRLSRRS